MHNHWEHTVQLPQCTSVFTAECYAVSMVLKIKNENIENIIIYKDSLGVLTVLHSRNVCVPMMGDILHSKISYRRGT